MTCLSLLIFQIISAYLLIINFNYFHILKLPLNDLINLNKQCFIQTTGQLITSNQMSIRSTEITRVIRKKPKCELFFSHSNLHCCFPHKTTTPNWQST